MWTHGYYYSNSFKSSVTRSLWGIPLAKCWLSAMTQWWGQQLPQYVHFPVFCCDKFKLLYVWCICANVERKKNVLSFWHVVECMEVSRFLTRNIIYKRWWMDSLEDVANRRDWWRVKGFSTHMGPIGISTQMRLNANTFIIVPVDKQACSTASIGTLWKLEKETPMNRRRIESSTSWRCGKSAKQKLVQSLNSLMQVSMVIITITIGTTMLISYWNVLKMGRTVIIITQGWRDPQEREMEDMRHIMSGRENPNEEMEDGEYRRQGWQKMLYASCALESSR